MLNRIVFLSLVLANFAFAADDLSLRKDPSCVAYLALIREPLVARNVGYEFPLRVLRKRFPDSPYPEALKNFETEVFHLFTEVPPLARDWEDFRNRWQLTSDELLDVQTYYGLLIFDGVPELVGDRPPLIERVSDLAFDHFLKYSQDPAAQRFAFYSEQVGVLSVPELARHFEISEAQVYRDLAMLRISLVEEFYDLAPAERGAQATRFMEHHTGIRRRGVEWQRPLPYPDATSRSYRMESDVLVALFDEGYNYQQIATQLNELAGVHDAGHEFYRSELSVSRKAAALGLNEARPVQDLHRVIEPYGYVKISGRLIPASTAEFIIDHRASHSLEWMARKLGVHVSSLEAFLKRQHLSALVDTDLRLRQNSVLGGPESLAQLTKRMAKRDEAYLKLHQFVLRERRIPRSEDSAKVLGISVIKFYGLYTYEKGEEKQHLAAHASTYDALQASLQRLASNDALSGEEKAIVSEILSKALEKEGFERLTVGEKRSLINRRLHRFIAVEGKVPSTAPKGGKCQFNEVTQVDYQRFFGIDRYENAAPRLNDSREDALRNLLADIAGNSELNVEEKKKVTQVVQAKLDDEVFSKQPREAQNLNFAQKIASFIIENDTFPSEKELYAITGVYAARIFSNGAYKNLGINSDRLTGLADIKAQLARVALAEKDRARVEEIFDYEIRDTKLASMDVQGQARLAIAWLIRYIAKTGALPRDWNARNILPTGEYCAQATGINRTKLHGIGPYGKGGKLAHNRLFDSARAVLVAAEAAAATSPDLNDTDRAKVIALLREKLGPG